MGSWICFFGDTYWCVRCTLSRIAHASPGNRSPASSFCWLLRGKVMAGGYNNPVYAKCAAYIFSALYANISPFCPVALGFTILLAQIGTRSMGYVVGLGLGLEITRLCALIGRAKVSTQIMNWHFNEILKIVTKT